MVEINRNKHNIEVNGIRFNNIPENLSSSFLSRLIVILDWNYELVNFDPNWNIFNFWWSKIFDISWNTFVVEYENQSDLIINKQIFEDKLKKEWFFSKELDNWRQIPEVFWDFEYNWKYYLILEALNKKTDEFDEELWIYKWVIISSQNYFWLHDDTINEIKGNSSTIWKIVDNK